MTIRDWLDDQLGGLIPWPGADRTVHTVDGATYELTLVWLRRRFQVVYHTPNFPRSIRRSRAADLARREAADRQRRLIDSGVYRFQIGEVLPTWVREVPAHVREVRDSQFDVWRRPVDDSERFHDGQAYDWVQPTRTGEIAGWTTDEGFLDHQPVTVTAVAVDNEDAHHAA